VTQVDLLDEHREIEPPDSGNRRNGVNEPVLSPPQSPFEDLRPSIVNIRPMAE
jgi:hypothetical protein